MRRVYLIEPFSGSHSVSRALKRWLRGIKLHVLSVDSDPKSHPRVLTDINKWNYKLGIEHFPKGRRRGDIVAIHASPPCTAFSRVNTTGVRDIEGGSRNVKKALKIIKYVRPDIWTLENPVGLLKDQPFMRPFEKYKNTTSYCKWGRAYKKPTNIWSNVGDLDLPMCNSETPCAHKANYGHHQFTAQSGDTSNGKSKGSGGGKNVYPLPSRLVCHIYKKGIEQL